MEEMVLSTPLHLPRDDPAHRTSQRHGLHTMDEWIVGDRDDGDGRRAEQPRDGCKHGVRINHVLEHFRADDAVEALRGEIQLVDLAFYKSNLVSLEVLPSLLEVHARDIDRGEPRAREHAQDLTAT